MRHLAAGTPCPIDERPAGRVKCSPCRYFVSYRAVIGIDAPNDATIGCDYGSDVVTWLRHQMKTAPRPPQPKSNDPVVKIGLLMLGAVVVASLFDRKEDRR